MRIAILQTNYIPWKGYFSLIKSVDRLILYEDAQFTSSDWRNRNYIKTAQGRQVLTVPVLRNFGQRIREVQIARDDWAEKHLESIRHCYRRSEHFGSIFPWMKDLYKRSSSKYLSEINQNFIYAIMRYLQIETEVLDSSDFQLYGDKNQKLINMCLETGAQTYVSGPSAKKYINEEMFQKKGIEVSWFDYSNLPIHPQMWGPYIQGVSVVDLLFNCGESSRIYL